MALEAITSRYLSNFNTNELSSSSSSFVVGHETHETQEVIGFCLKGKEAGSFPAFPHFPSYDLPSYSSSAALCQSSSALASSFGPMDANDQQRLEGLSAENQKKRRRSRSSKNRQDLETQRMTHITVERNRRRQMNEHLAMLRSLMPESYIQRGDQASIVGGAIDFVKELEQLVQSLEVEKRESDKTRANLSQTPFSRFFTCPQYAFTSRVSKDPSPENPRALADIEVTMSETHANLKVLSLRRPKQLLQMVAGLQSLHLTVLHLNVTTMDPFVLYTFSTKVEEECKLSSVEDIAAATYQLLIIIHEEAAMSGLDPKLEKYS
ncbi:transcription factor bHLH94-like [Nymphaea colorata]|nr:transcription factor bHLH94-like [Nymphaea colorata]